jgi:hypothetical protein
MHKVSEPPSKRLSGNHISPICSLTPNERNYLNRSESTKEANMKITNKKNDTIQNTKVNPLCSIATSKRTSLQKNNLSTKEISQNVKKKQSSFLEMSNRSESNGSSIVVDYDSIFINEVKFNIEDNSEDKKLNSNFCAALREENSLKIIICMVKGFNSYDINSNDQERLLLIIGQCSAFERFNPSRFREQINSEGFTYIDLIICLNLLSIRMINLVLVNNNTNSYLSNINNNINMNQNNINSTINDMLKRRSYNFEDDITLTLVKIGIAFLPIYLYIKSQIVKRLNIYDKDSIYPSLNIVLQDFILGPAVIQACNCTEILFDLSQEEYRKFEKKFYENNFNNNLLSASYLDIDILNIGCVCLNQDPIAQFLNLFLFQEVINSNKEYIESPFTFKGYTFDNKTIERNLSRLNIMFRVLLKNTSVMNYKPNVEKKMMKYFNDLSIEDRKLKTIFQHSFSYTEICRLTSSKLNYCYVDQLY